MISFFRKGNPRGSHCVCDDRARERLLDLECWDRRTLQLPGQLLPPTVHQLSDQCRKRRSHYQCKIHVPVHRFHYQYKIDWFQNQYKIGRFYYQCRKLLLHYHQNICEFPLSVQNLQVSLSVQNTCTHVSLSMQETFVMLTLSKTQVMI